MSLRTPAKQLLSATRHWLSDMALFAARKVTGRNPRFCLLTPPFSARQAIFDARSGQIIRVGIRNAIDYLVVRQIFSMNDYGFEKLTRCGELLEWYAALVASGKTPLILDCGANSGMATRFFGHTFPAARVVAVEPDKDNMALAKANNAGTETRFYLAGVGATNAAGRIANANADNWSFSLVHDPLGDVRIDSILEECCTDGVVPFIIKRHRRIRERLVRAQHRVDRTLPDPRDRAARLDVPEVGPIAELPEGHQWLRSGLRLPRRERVQHIEHAQAARAARGTGPHSGRSRRLSTGLLFVAVKTPGGHPMLSASQAATRRAVGTGFRKRPTPGLPGFLSPRTSPRLRC